jgi:putative ABC transport system permease protein
MKNRRIIISGFLVMGRYKMRTFFMMVGIIIGITALTLILSVGKGTEKKVMDNIETMFSANSILISAVSGQMRGGPHSGGPTTMFTVDDLDVLQEEISNIDLWDTLQVLPAREVKYLENSDNIRVIGHSERADRVWNIGVTRGELFDSDAVLTSARVALIGTHAVDTLFGETDPIGEQIRIGNVPFRIIGILKERGVDLHGWDRDNEILVPYTTALRRLMNIDYIQTAKLLVKDHRKMERTVERITVILRERHALAENVPDDFSIFTPVLVQEMVSSANRIFNLFLPLIAGISLLVGGVIVANLMLISVSERNSEIGLRKAVGARSKDIQLQFLTETTFITLMGGLIGIVLGLAGTQLVSAVMELPVTLSWQALALGVIFSTLVGLIAGIFPARRAASLQPVESLR